MNRQYNNQGEKWAALYVRFSRDDENEGDSNSIQHQIEIIEKYCDKIVYQETLPFKLSNLRGTGQATDSPSLLTEVQSMGRAFGTSGSSMDTGDKYVNKALSFIAGGSYTKSNSKAFQMKLAPTEDPTRFMALISVSLGSLNDADQVTGVYGRSSTGAKDLDYAPGFRELMTLAGRKSVLQYGGEVLDEFARAKARSGINNKEWGVKGYMEGMVFYDFNAKSWKVQILNGGFNAGGGMSRSWHVNTWAGIIPFTATLTMGATGQVSMDALAVAYYNSKSKAVILGTTYNAENPVKRVAEAENGEIVSFYVPAKHTSMFTATETYMDKIEVPDFLPDYDAIQLGASTQIQFTVENKGIHAISDVTIQVGDKETTFQDLNLLPGSSIQLYADYIVPDNKVVDPQYRVEAVFDESSGAAGSAETGGSEGFLFGRIGARDGSNVASGTIYLDLTDVGITTNTEVVDAVDGLRTVQLGLYNAQAAKLADSGRTVRLSFFSDAAYSDPIGDGHARHAAEGHRLFIAGYDLKGVGEVLVVIGADRDSHRAHLALCCHIVEQDGQGEGVQRLASGAVDDLRRACRVIPRLSKVDACQLISNVFPAGPF